MNLISQTSYFLRYNFAMCIWAYICARRSYKEMQEEAIATIAAIIKCSRIIFNGTSCLAGHTIRLELFRMIG